MITNKFSMEYLKKKSLLRFRVKYLNVFTSYANSSRKISFVYYCWFLICTVIDSSK